MAKLKLPAGVLAAFREFGRKGGKVGGSAGGKKSLTTMTKAERVARARVAGTASGAARAKAASKRKKLSQ